MCESKTTIGYGIMVTSWSLEVAYIAHDQLVKPLLALDMIISRIKAGTIVVGVDGPRILPVEMIDMIRLELIDLELHQAVRTINRYNCFPHEVCPEHIGFLNHNVLAADPDSLPPCIRDQSLEIEVSLINAHVDQQRYNDASACECVLL